MPELIRSTWLDQLDDPEERLVELHRRMAEASEAYITADLEARLAGKARHRALTLMVDLRHTIVQVCAECGLEPPATRLSQFLDALDGE